MSNALSKHATVHYGTQLVERCRAMLAVILCAWSMIIFGGTAAADTPQQGWVGDLPIMQGMELTHSTSSPMWLYT